MTTPSASGITWNSREATSNKPQLVIDTGTSSTGDPVVAAAGDIACDPAYASYNGGVALYPFMFGGYD